MSEQIRCPKCGQDKGELLYTQSAVKTIKGLRGDYANRGFISFYECQNCGHKWSSFSKGGGPLWTLPMED